MKATAWVAGAAIVNRRTAANVGGFTLQVNSTSGQINFYVYIGSTWYVATTPAGLSSGVWHHLVGTYDGANLRIYADGILAATTAVAGSINNPSPPLLLIGKSAAAAAYFNGSIDEVAVYPAALSAGRILAHYQSSQLAPIPTTGTSVGTYNGDVSIDRPVGYWRLGEPAGTIVVTDSSGNGNAGTSGGAGLTLGQAGALATDSATSASFNGSSTAYVSVPYAAVYNPSGAFTLEAWVKVTGGQNTWRALVSTACTTCTGYTGFELYARADNTWGAYVANGSSGWGYVVGPAVVLNQWTHLVETYTGNTLSLYVNGSLIGTATSVYVATTSSSVPLYIGTDITASGARSYFLTGSVQEVAVYPTALSRARILARFNAAWDLTQRRVATVQDARGITVASFAYNDATATTQVIDGRGLPSYYTYQYSGGRTVANTDPGNNLTDFQYDSAAPYRLIATNSPTAIQHYTLVNTSAAVGQQHQVLMADDSGQRRASTVFLMNGGYPDPSQFGASTLLTTGESWIWDSTVTVQPGMRSHRSTPMAGNHQHYLQFATPILIPAGSSLSQWVYIEPGVQAPDELQMQFEATDASDWGHRAAWGAYGLFGAFGCPANCQQSSLLPGAGHWAQLTVNLGPREGAPVQFDVDMAGRLMKGITFSLYGGLGAVWWGPTMFTFPGGSVSDPARTINRYAYNATNDLVTSVDPNGIATVRDIDARGLTLASSTGVEPAPPIGLFQDDVKAIGPSAWQLEFGYAGTSALVVTSPQHNGIGSLTQTHSGAGLQSDLWKDFSGLTPGTYLRVSVWVQTSVGATGIGGASLMVENHLNGALNSQRRSASVQSVEQWVQLTMPFVVDVSGQVRVHLWQENLQGTTTWADIHVDDLTPAPDVTLQHPLAVFASGFVVQPNAAWTAGSAVALNDPSQAHTGLYSFKDTIANNNTTNTISSTLSLPASATYRVSAWVRTVLSGGTGGTGGAQLCAQFAAPVCYPSAVPYNTTEGQWQQLSISLAGSGTLTLQLKHANWQGDVYWDDVNVERVADAIPASSGGWHGTAWTGSVNGTAAATWASSWTAGPGGGPSRQIAITSAGGTTDISDTLATSALRIDATYVMSLWASSTAANSTITLGVAGQTLDLSPTCVLQLVPTLCQNSFTYHGAYPATNNLTINYGGQGARTVTIVHPLVALASELFDYTAYGQLSRVHDIFSHSTTTTFDSNSLYATQSVVTATPSPNLVSSFTYNSLGQLILNTRVNGGQTIAEQIWLDSWGRQVGEIGHLG